MEISEKTFKDYIIKALYNEYGFAPSQSDITIISKSGSNASARFSIGNIEYGFVSYFIKDNNTGRVDICTDGVIHRIGRI